MLGIKRQNRGKQKPRNPGPCPDEETLKAFIERYIRLAIEDNDIDLIDHLDVCETCWGRKTKRSGECEKLNNLSERLSRVGEAVEVFSEVEKYESVSRETAVDILLDLNKKYISALQKANKSPDDEVRCHVEDLIEDLQQRIRELKKAKKQKTMPAGG